jgi:hypothetical protein
MRREKIKIIPQWVRKLPPGEYSLNQLNSLIKEVCKANIFLKFDALNVEKSKKRKESDNKSIYYYNWKGFSFYYSQKK